MVQAQVSRSVLLDGAQMSLAAFLVGTMGFLKEREIPIKEWLSYIGESFEDSWGGLQGEKPGRVLRHLLNLQVRPLGADVISSQTTAEKAEVVLTSLPSQSVLEKFGTTPRELLRGFGVTQREFSSLYSMFEPPAKAIGLKFTHQLKGGQQVLRLEQAAGSGQKRPRRVAKRS